MALWCLSDICGGLMDTAITAVLIVAIWMWATSSRAIVHSKHIGTFLDCGSAEES